MPFDIAFTRRKNSVSVIWVGQARLILPVPENQSQAPYALTGRAGREADAWEKHGHWIDAGQSRIYVPATR